MVEGAEVGCTDQLALKPRVVHATLRCDCEVGGQQAIQAGTESDFENLHLGCIGIPALQLACVDKDVPRFRECAVPRVEALPVDVFECATAVGRCDYAFSQGERSEVPERFP